MSESSAALSYEVFVSAQIPTTSTLPTGAPLQWSPLSTTLISGATDAVLDALALSAVLGSLTGDWCAWVRTSYVVEGTLRVLRVLRCQH